MATVVFICLMRQHPGSVWVLHTTLMCKYPEQLSPAVCMLVYVLFCLCFMFSIQPPQEWHMCHTPLPIKLITGVFSHLSATMYLPLFSFHHKVFINNKFSTPFLHQPQSSGVTIHLYTGASLANLAQYDTRYA